MFKKRYSYYHLIILFIACYLLILPLNVNANNEAYESAKDTFTKFNKSFSEVKDNIDSTYEFFDRFHRAVDIWRNAVTRETQNKGIEEIDKLADDKIEAVIDSLYEKLSISLNIPDGIKIPQSMKEKAVERLREKFKGYVPDKIANRLGYMYTLSSIDRKLRDNYIYENLKYIKQGFDKGSSLLGNFNNAIKFIDTFSPQSAESSPVGRLNKVKDFLSLISDISKPIPLMSDVIDAYAKATQGFMIALTDLDNKLREARQGSLCGQRGVDMDIQDYFQKNYPQEDCLTYFLLTTSQYPHLGPIRIWEGFERSQIFIWLDGRGTLISSNNFHVMYKYYYALKESYSYNKYVTHEQFFNIAMAASKSNLSTIADRFNSYYKKFEKDYNFKEILEFEGLYKNGIFKSLHGTSLIYQLGGSAEEFGGLCFFNSNFRNSVEQIFNKYKDAYTIKGTIKSSNSNAVIKKITVFIDNTPPKELRCVETCSFKHVLFSERYNISIKAEGFQEVNKSFVKDAYPLITLISKDIPQHSFTLKILGADSGEVGKDYVFYAELKEQAGVSDINTQPQPQISFSWSVNGRSYGGNDSNQRIRFDSSGSYTIVVYAWQWSISEKRWLKIAEARHYFKAYKSTDNDKKIYPSPTPLPTITPTPTFTPRPTPTYTPSATLTQTPRPKQFNELTKDEQQKVLDCLCRCNSTATSSVAVYYETKPISASPSCNDPSNGPCVNQGFGCWRHVPQNTGSCAERCYKSANILSVPDSYMNKK